MSPITATAEINRRATDVFAYATDPTRFAAWQKGVVEGHMAEPGTPSAGARCLTTRRIGFVKRPVTSELVHVDPPRTWSVRGMDGQIRAAVDVIVESVADNRSRLTISIYFQGHGMGKLLVPLVVRREARKEMPDNLATLKALLERSP